MTISLQISQTPQGEEAPVIAQHRRQVSANPGDARAHALLGITLQQHGLLHEAVECQRRALALEPNLPGLHGVLALALHDLGRLEEAVAAYRVAIGEQPDDAELHCRLSEALRQLGQYEPAEASARRALALRPDDPDMQLALAAVLHAAAKHGEAEAALRRLLEIAPDNVDALFDLGNTLLNQSDHAAAAAVYRQVLERQPDYVPALNNLASCVIKLHDLNGAEHYYRRALKLRPDHPTIPRDLGFVVNSLARLDEAKAILEEAVARHPDDLVARSFLALNRFDAGMWDDALAHCRVALAGGRAPAEIQSGMLFLLSHCSSDPAELTAAHKGFGTVCEEPLRGRIAPHDNDRDPHRVLRIGFVSPDLYHHAVANFLQPVLAVLKLSTQLELHAYYTNTLEDKETARLRGHFAHWNDVARLDDEALDARIRADRIDILVDLSGHSARNRLGLFARKPAPLQASWIGYAGSTGLQAMDYYITDQFHLPEGRYDDQFTEKMARLPLSAPFLPNPNAPDVNPLPALRNGYLTFGSFHRPNKLGRGVIAQWAKLLRALPDAKMLLGGLFEGNDYQLVDWFAEEGIERSRLLLRNRSHMQVYLSQHHEVDVCLSPFPYSGSTTICHALWMGVPTLATLGPTNPSHSAACYLAHLGLSSFIAHDEDNLVQLACFLNENLPTLAALRGSLRERFVRSVVGYPGVTAAGLEHVFRQMWQRWCAGLPPEHLKVSLSELSS